MRLRRFLTRAALLALPAILVPASQAHAQYNAGTAPTATASLHFQAWGGVGANYTGLGLGRNLDLVAGADIIFKSFAGFYPTLEGRGAYPIDRGQLDSQKNILAGLKMARHKQRFAGYGDILFGRGKITYANGYPDVSGNFLVLSNTSNVLSFGGGVDINTGDHLGFKGDFQLQQYDTPVTASGSLYSKVFTAGLIYRFGTGSIRARPR